ncbi:cystathionine beta-synthase, putative [Trypanosoma equiperdum]|uniref:Cystathionine beta-synthase, putative n=3 Tax=Trypanozoon TaxID=39700 RepID=Q384R5_TRYB2|nr:cystathionine beta-synthase, putative [Trypanosoma brucei gambiense DAL972]XP_828828.1 cystathionine beta-synthase, putative [Trypanosoma brucei brucei TREU927]EAN79716.1 cystathionine beta-synthase, putative [Trypanosoma brucei brucei TREU927]CBH17740.1 cystathionine beta-synthase, putative [Trypanosoma brucei gambiense DAL972]SCU70858.1 cystathionine beta-synthase, putative [Trypanosoma equiperdum]|eukprot:XP_011780004.1 cystathionine beta-synthase, putative [Trypanosoma brucei gambiense DAL972]
MKDQRTTILDSVLDTIGSTPCIRLNRLPNMHGIQCEVVAKCEFFNPGGSVKDRIALKMVLDAEASGRLPPNSTLVEATSGNTGIGLSLVGSVRGHRVVITMPKKMSHEKEVVVRALGAEVIRTETSLAWDHPESLIGVARRLEREEGYVFLDQYRNPSNPGAHYESTGQEIYDQCGGKVDMVILGAGTGGTITGVAKKLKSLLPDVIVVGVDPVGSLLADPANPPKDAKPYLVEGIGYDFVPDVCEREYVDKWVKSTDKESFELASQLHREEGLLVGGSSGSAMWGVLQAAKDLGPNQRCVVVFPDGIRNYMSKFPDVNWRIEKKLESGEVTRPTYENLQAELEGTRKKLAEYEAKLGLIGK